MSGLPHSQSPASLGSDVADTNQTFGKYHMFATLGRGGMAEVFLAVARGPVGFNKLVVLKRLRTQLAEEAAFRDMFLDEARLAARLNHPNIVNTFEVGENEGNYFIAMEYLEGQPLNKVLRATIKQRMAIPPAMCARMVADGLAGLGYAHTLNDYDGSPLGIIHRDVSPHNLFLQYEGHVKLVDFGIAKAASGSTETEVGVLKGKVAYMAPEQAMGEHVDSRADLFAMGVVLWELLTQQRLFPGDNPAATLHKLLHEPIPRVSELVPNVPRELDNITARALQRDPLDRFQTAAEMRAALESYLARGGAGVGHDEVSAFVMQLFAKVREDTQSKIRSYMAQFNQATSTQEMRALTAESLRRVQTATGQGGSLMRLSGGGTGSQVGPLSATPSPSARGGLLLPVIVGGCFLLAGVGLLVVGLQQPASNAGDGVVAVDMPVPPMQPVVVPPVPATTAAVAPSVAPSVTDPAALPVVAAPAHTGSRHSGGNKDDGKKTEKTKSNDVNAASGSGASTVEPGYLTLDSYPWSKVTVGGRILGTTPLVRVALPPGSHTLTLENAEQGLKKVMSISIESGKATSRRVEIR